MCSLSMFIPQSATLSVSSSIFFSSAVARIYRSSLVLKLERGARVLFQFLGLYGNW